MDINKIASKTLDISIAISRNLPRFFGERVSVLIGLFVGLLIAVVIALIWPALYGTLAYLVSLFAIKWLGVTTILGWTVDPLQAATNVFLFTVLMIVLFGPSERSDDATPPKH